MEEPQGPSTTHIFSAHLGTPAILRRQLHHSICCLSTSKGTSLCTHTHTRLRPHTRARAHTYSSAVLLIATSSYLFATYNQSLPGAGIRRQEKEVDKTRQSERGTPHEQHRPPTRNRATVKPLSETLFPEACLSLARQPRYRLRPHALPACKPPTLRRNPPPMSFQPAH